MLRLHRHRQQAKSGEKLDFRFSSLKALQVPKGWDRLVVSFVSAETGKTVAKTSKATVRHGSCQWTETLLESVRFSEDDSVKEIEDCVFKLVVSMGSGRTGILGEATVNMTDYMSTSDSVPVSLSLKKCSHGTTLQVKIQCLTPRVKSMEEDSAEKPNGNHQEYNGSGSDTPAAKSLKSSSGDNFRLNSNPGELQSRETSFSISESRQSYDSAEGSIVGEDVSVGAESLGSGNSESPGIRRAEVFHSKQSSFSSQVSENSRHEFSAKAFREASEGTVEELRAEAKMWERNARKLMLDLDVLKAEFHEHSRANESLSSELEQACAERDGLKEEIEQLNRKSSDNLIRDDLRFQRESNADLAMQLKRSHESNIELVSVLQELEETMEKQKIEIDELRASQKQLERSFEEKKRQMEIEHERKLLEKEGAVEELKGKVRELEKDCTELTEENLDLLFKLKEAKNEPMGMSTSVDFPARTSFEFQLSEQNMPTSFVDEILERNDHNSVQELQRLSIELEAKLVEMDRESAERRTGMENLELSLRSKEEEISGLRQSRSELEAKVSDLQKEKAQLQEHLEVALQESDISSKCLNDLQNDLAALTSSIDSHCSANEALERRSSEFETGYRELELHVSELERESARLSGLVAGLEAQLENSKFHAANLNDERDSLQKLNEESSNEKIELRDRCSLLESKLAKSQKGFADCSRKVEDLEQHLSSVLAEFASKEKSLASEIEALFEENSRHKENFNHESSLLNQMYNEKVVEAEKLRQQVNHLSKKLSETTEEREQLALDSLSETSRLRAENEKLEAEFREAQSKLATSNQGLEKLSELLESYKASEEKLKANISSLELRLTVSEYQSQQNSEQCARLKAELEKLAQLEDELGETKAENAELGEKIAALKALVSELEAQNSEKLALQEKVLQMEDELVEIEVLRVRDTELKKELSQIRRENRQHQQALERKVSTTSKATNKVSPVHETAKNTKNEIAKGTNQRRDARRTRSHKESGGGSESPDGSPRKTGDIGSKIQLLEDQLAKALEENSKYKVQLSKLSSEGRKGNADSQRKPSPEAELVSKVKYERTKSSLEEELREIRERYLSMSLKYAEVESQREELVMKLRAAKTSKRWFS